MSAARAIALVAWAWALAAISFGGCRRADDAGRADPAIAPSSRASAQASAQPACDAHLRCESHEDCALSCARGAVNAAWLAQWRKTHGECKDGCLEEGHAARCDGGRCVALHEDGTLDRGCTEVPLP